MPSLLSYKNWCLDGDVLLVLDDTMMSVRCGKLFSFHYYSTVFSPDFIIVGKVWLCGMMFAMSPRALEISSEICHLNGVVTSAVNSLSILIGTDSESVFVELVPYDAVMVATSGPT